MNKLEIQKFIEQHPDWEKRLQEKPYCLVISRDVFNGQNLIMLKYNQIDSDFNEPIVRECRGLILDADTYEIVSYPFNKFGNVSEGGWVDTIDWSSAHTTEKVDGSLIKIVNVGNNLLVSTNGTILASNAFITPQPGCPYKSFGDIVADVLDKIFKAHGLDEKIKLYGLEDVFKEGFTYMFELVSPWTRVVVPFHDNDIYFLGCRDNTTHQEIFFGDHPLSKFFKTPKIYPLQTLDECLKATKDMPWDEEGYVVVDKYFHRNKIKSFAYLAAHHLKNNGVMSYRRAIELVRLNEVDEILAYFPEFRDGLLEVKSRFWNAVEESEKAWEEYQKIDMSLPTRKDKALWITKNFKIPGLAFGLLDNKIASVKSFFMDVPTDKIAKMLGYKE